MKNKIDEIMERFKSPLDGEISVYSMADYIFELERKLQNTAHNSDYAKCSNCGQEFEIEKGLCKECSDFVDGCFA